MKYINFANRIANNSIEITITLIDLSGSMLENDWKPSRMAGAVEANKELIKIKIKNYPQDKMGIIGFGDYAKVLHQPVPVIIGKMGLSNVLDSLEDMGQTNITSAMELAEKEFFDKNSIHYQKSNVSKFSNYLTNLLYGTQEKEHKSPEQTNDENNVTRRIILLSDGEHNVTGRCPIKVAERLKDSNVIIDCIGIGGSPRNIDEKTLKMIASVNPDGTIRYCFIKDKQQLIKKYNSLANHICKA